MTDTLGRVIYFCLRRQRNLTAIRQTWAGVTHDWATFYYGQVYVAPAFGGGLQVNGPNNNYTTVLTQVNLHDGTYFVFDYNAAFAQVTQIKHYAADTSLVNYVYYNLNTAAGQTECPRIHARGATGPETGTAITMACRLRVRKRLRTSAPPQIIHGPSRPLLMA